MRIISLNPKLCDETQQYICSRKKKTERDERCVNLDCFNGIDSESIQRCFNDLKQNIVLSGGNGSGKSRLFKLIEEKNQALHLRVTKENESATVELDYVKIINFSCTDASLQSVEKFPTYTISKANNHLYELDVTETALNSLLYIHGLAKGQIGTNGDFESFASYVNPMFFIDNETLKLSRDTNKNALFFGRAIDGDELSPGQKYLLRMAVALYLNKGKHDVIFLLDEPETHLHPNVLIRFYDKLREEFPKSQIWIATHSIALIAHIEQKYESDSSIFYFENGKVSTLRSNSEPLIRGLVGGDDNWNAYFHFLVEPDAYASNKFAIECLTSPDVKPGTKRKDEQAGLVIDKLTNKIVVDYGAGRGRLISGIQEWLTEKGVKINEVVKEFRAFDIKQENGEDNEYKAECLRAMNEHGLGERYFDDIEKLKSESPADYVFMVNVLHEIDPGFWVGLFANIAKLLKDDGFLIIVEQKELTIGEKAYKNGFIILTEKSAKALFDTSIDINSPKDIKSIEFKIPKPALSCTREKITSCLTLLMSESLDVVKHIRQNTHIADGEHYKFGLKLAFWEHQHTNSELCIASLKEENQDV